MSIFIRTASSSAVSVPWRCQRASFSNCSCATQLTSNLSIIAATQRLARSPLLSRPTPYQARLLSRSVARLQPLAPETRQKIQDAVTADPLVVFMKGTPDMPQCGFSRAVMQVLEVQGVRPEKMKTYNILEDQALREGIKEFSEWPTIPQVYVNGEFYGGCDIILSSECIHVHQSGELEALLEKADVLLPLPPADGAKDKK